MLNLVNGATRWYAYSFTACLLMAAVVGPSCWLPGTSGSHAFCFLFFDVLMFLMQF